MTTPIATETPENALPLPAEHSFLVRMSMLTFPGEEITVLPIPHLPAESCPWTATDAGLRRLRDAFGAYGFELDRRWTSGQLKEAYAHVLEVAKDLSRWQRSSGHGISLKRSELEHSGRHDHAALLDLLFASRIAETQPLHARLLAERFARAKVARLRTAG